MTAPSDTKTPKISATSLGGPWIDWPIYGGIWVVAAAGRCRDQNENRFRA